MIKLHVEPTVVPVPWDTFLRSHSPYSIALDGYVSAGPRFSGDESGPHANFNHHEEVDRLATRATCGQVLMAIRQGLFACFRDADGPRVHAYVNDCDEDVCASWFLLKHHHMVRGHSNPRLNRLVYLEDALDCTAGAYPFPPDMPALEQLAWVFQPYRLARLSGALDSRNVDVFTGVIDAVCDRIMTHVAGDGGERMPLDTRYERIGGGRGWIMTREIGAQARTGMFADGHAAFVAARERGDGRWTYSVGRTSPFVPFDVPGILAALNAAEQCADDRWGGGNTIGGSPRVRGSGLSPTQVEQIVLDTCG